MGKNKPGVGSHFLLQGIFPTQELNLCLLWLLHWQVASLPLAPLGKPKRRCMALQTGPPEWFPYSEFTDIIHSCLPRVLSQPFKQVQLSICSLWHIYCDMCFNLNISFITDETDREECGFSSCCCSVSQSRLTLCDPIDWSTPGLPVPHPLPESAQVHAHYICDAVQTSHPLTPFSPSSLHLSEHQDLFQWVPSLNQMTKILELQL